MICEPRFENPLFPVLLFMPRHLHDHEVRNRGLQSLVLAHSPRSALQNGILHSAPSIGQLFPMDQMVLLGNYDNFQNKTCLVVIEEAAVTKPAVNMTNQSV